MCGMYGGETEMLCRRLERQLTMRSLRRTPLANFPPKLDFPLQHSVNGDFEFMS